LLESVILVYERLVGPLTAAERDGYCAEALPVAVALAAREDEVPGTWAELGAYLDRMYASEAIVVGSQARELAKAVLAPSGSWLVAPAGWVNRMMTVGMLPPHVREQYAMSWTPRQERTLGHLVSTLRLSRRWLPDAIALWPDARR
jgi:uncharacterized protein (DUF2236 family)